MTESTTERVIFPRPVRTRLCPSCGVQHTETEYPCVGMEGMTCGYACTALCRTFWMQLELWQ